MSTSNDMAIMGEMKGSPLPKACENCRIRKIRCNRANPCSNCSSSGIECRPSTKQAEHRPRMIVSNHYEKQIDRIHERLIGIEAALKSFSISQTSSTPQSHASQPLSVSTSASTSTLGQNQYQGQYHGDSSFQSQSIHASEVARSLSIKHDEDLTHVFDSLKDIGSIELAAPHHVHFSQLEDRPEGPEMEMLPSDVVIQILNRVKQTPPACFLSLALPSDGQLERLCQRAYFPTDQMSLGEMTSMYGMLWTIIREYILLNDPILGKFDAKKYVEVCETNFHTGIETYELLVDPTFDNAFSLMLAAHKAQDEGKMILCWTLASSAARQVQALGYHREATLIGDDLVKADRKRHLFWTIYSLEKNMSLSLGRASSFNDWDIDVKMFQISKDPTTRPWGMGAIVFIELARIQGQMYEQLYSITASSKSSAERLKIIDVLSRSLDYQYKIFRSVDFSQAIHSDMYSMIYEACDVIYYSLLTLLHRAACNPGEGAEISAKCFEAARTCLKCHLHYFPAFAKQGEAMLTGYINWILLYCSFTPFIVVFLHAIASMNMEDVKLLKDMTDSLEPASDVSPNIHRLHSTCQVFSHVAEVLVRAKDQQLRSGRTAGIGTYDQQTDSLLFPGFTGHGGFDPHALPEIFTQGNTVHATGSNFDDMSAYFGNWVGSNQPVMDLFNMDFGQQNM